jgi:RHS repeat-associated protein
LSVNPASIALGGSVTATWSGIATPSPTDWIGLYAPGTANTAFLEWVYVSCTKSPGAAQSSGSCAFAIPAGLAAGSYELRLLANDGYNALASSAITVGAAASSAGIYYIHTDHLGTPRLITNQAGQVLWRWDNSEPFGDSLPNGSITFNLRFAGQYFDAETGLHYNYFRDYDPASGRFIESDPIGLLGGINTYLYAIDPLTQTDPWGLLGRGHPNRPSSIRPIRFGGGEKRCNCVVTPLSRQDVNVAAGATGGVAVVGAGVGGAMGAGYVMAEGTILGAAHGFWSGFVAGGVLSAAAAIPVVITVVILGKLLPNPFCQCEDPICK